MALVTGASSGIGEAAALAPVDVADAIMFVVSLPPRANVIHPVAARTVTSAMGSPAASVTRP